MPDSLKKSQKGSFFTSLWIHGLVITIIFVIFALKKTEKQTTEVSLTNGNARANSESSAISSSPRTTNPISVPIHSEINPSTETANLQKKSADQTTSTPNTKTGFAGSDAQNSADSQANSYILEISRRIQAEERYPVEARKRGIAATIEVSFELNDQGQITEIHSVSPGKPQILIEAAMEAVRAASPFPAPPAGRMLIFQIPIEFKIK